MIRADLLIEGAAEVVTCAAPTAAAEAVTSGKASSGPHSGGGHPGSAGSIVQHSGGGHPDTAGSSGQHSGGGHPGGGGPIAGQSIGTAIPAGVVACAGERIVFVGTAEECRRAVILEPGGRRLDAQGGVVLPGFVDPHTHLPFGGWREAEFERRLAGASYQEIAQAGGGILSTVRATRALPPSELAALVHGRLDQMLVAGTTTVEAKSGYGLSLESEIAILEGLALAAEDHPVEVVRTLLGAHVVPPKYRDGRRAEYVRVLVEELIPCAAREGLACFCDVFVDEGAFTIEEARRILETARRHGLGLRLHAEQLTHTGAAVLGVSLGAFSVDHLERLTEDDVAALAASWSGAGTSGAGTAPAGAAGAAGEGAGAVGSAGAAGDTRQRRYRSGLEASGSEDAQAQEGRASAARLIAETNGRGPWEASGSGLPAGREARAERAGMGTVAILLPGAAFFLRESARPPVRALIAAGVPVALATDFNPGTSPCLAMPPILNLACLLFGMTPDEAIVAATRNAALSLGIEDRVGSIEAGKQADLVIWRVPDRRHLAYRFGPIPCGTVVKKGRIVATDGRLAPSDGPHEIGGQHMLVDLRVQEFLDRLASKAPTPGGGSASALAGAQAAALLEMVMALTLGSDKYAASRPILEPMISKAKASRARLAALVDRDADAYDGVVAANRMPKQTDEEKAARKATREKALMFAAEVPLETAELACAVGTLAAEAAPHINPSAASDLLVAALLSDAGLAGAAANVRINLEGLKSGEFAAGARERLESWTRQSAQSLAAIRQRFAGMA